MQTYLHYTFLILLSITAVLLIALCYYDSSDTRSHSLSCSHQCTLSGVGEDIYYV